MTQNQKALYSFTDPYKSSTALVSFSRSLQQGFLLLSRTRHFPLDKIVNVQGKVCFDAHPAVQANAAVTSMQHKEQHEHTHFTPLNFKIHHICPDLRFFLIVLT